MEYYEDPNSCAPAPEPAPVDICEPAPLPAFEPPAYEPPAAEIFPDVPAEPAAPVLPEAPVPAAPVAYHPVADTQLSSGTLLGPSIVGGSTDAGAYVGGTPDLSAGGYVGGSPDLSTGGYVGGSPDLGASTTLGGTTPDLGGTWTHDDVPVAAPEVPVIPGPFNAIADNMMQAHNAALVNGALGSSGSTGTPAPWMPGFDSDHDGVLNERDANPRDRFS